MILATARPARLAAATTTVATVGSVRGFPDATFAIGGHPGVPGKLVVVLGVGRVVVAGRLNTPTSCHIALANHAATRKLVARIGQSLDGKVVADSQLKRAECPCEFRRSLQSVVVASATETSEVCCVNELLARNHFAKKLRVEFPGLRRVWPGVAFAAAGKLIEQIAPRDGASLGVSDVHPVVVAHLPGTATRGVADLQGVGAGLVSATQRYLR